MSDSVIQPFPPRDKNDWECQCARCGSSCEYVDCYNCEDGCLGSDCIDDLCHGGECIHGDSGQIQCDVCQGQGGWLQCLSGPEWCKSHPIPGREATEHGQIEWYKVKPVPTEDEWIERWEAAREAGQSSISREEALKRYRKEYPESY